MVQTIIFIPIRLGSKGIPNKNLRILGGKPLVCWVIDTLLTMNIPSSSIWVATDSADADELLRKRYGERVRIYIRSLSSATDSSPVINVVIEFLNHVNPVDDTRFVLVQATSPFTSAEDYSRLFSAMSEDVADSFVSCCRIKRFVWSEDGIPLSYTMEDKPMRQHYKGILLENGAFYASTVGFVRKSGLLLSGKIKVVETGDGTMIDIDEESDWQKAERYITQSNLTES